MKGPCTSPDPRRRAVEILARVEERGAHAARLLGDAVPATRELVLGSLRWQLTLDHLLIPFLRQPLAALEAPVRAALRAGLYEAMRMETPPPIAVFEVVRVARELAPRAAGLVNAVLRRAAVTRWPDPGDEAIPLAVRFSHPAWLVERWRGLLGEEAARRALAADQTPAPLCLLAAATRRAELEGAGCRLEAHPYVAGVLVCREGAAAVVAALRAGRAYAMDATAVAVARLLPAAGGTIVDLAAAPGGKSLVLATERQVRRHLALDRQFGRAALLRKTLAVAPHRAGIAVADAAAAPLRPGSCAAVLLDAPCSGTGTLRRHPEIRWRLGASDLAALTSLQRELARAAAALLEPGGHLLYATCSLEPEENGDVVSGLGLTSIAVGDALPAGVPHVELDSGGTVIPPSEEGDGFTVHLLRRDS